MSQREDRSPDPEEEGKNKVFFVSKEDHATPSTAELVEEDPDDSYEEKGLILPNGEINWNCPCLGGMASGPCGSEFKDAFSCFHYSDEEVKGSDCLEQFIAMQQCLQLYPELYQQDEEITSSQEAQDSSDVSAANTTTATSVTSASEQDSVTTQPNTEISEES